VKVNPIAVSFIQPRPGNDSHDPWSAFNNNACFRNGIVPFFSR